jgi:hypothetical protein
VLRRIQQKRPKNTLRLRLKSAWFLIGLQTPLICR